MTGSAVRQRARLVAAFALIAALALSACGARGDGEETAPADATAPTATFVVGGATNGTRVTVTNSGTDDICYVYIFDHGLGSWGEDHLGAKTLLEPGTGFGIPIAPDTPFNLRADDCNRRNVGQIDGVTVAEGEEFEWALAAGLSGEAQITVLNTGQEAVCFFNFKLSSDEEWGPEKLATASIIAPGESVSYPVPSGAYDLNAHDCGYNVIAGITNEQIDAGERFVWNVDA